MSGSRIRPPSPLAVDRLRIAREKASCGRSEPSASNTPRVVLVERRIGDDWAHSRERGVTAKFDPQCGSGGLTQNRFELERHACTLLILKRRDVRVVEGARLESNSGDARWATPKHFFAQLKSALRVPSMLDDVPPVNVGISRRFRACLTQFLHSSPMCLEVAPLAPALTRSLEQSTIRGRPGGNARW